jgi:outer membrane protein TolC
MKHGSASSKWISTLGIFSLVFTLTVVPSPVIMAQEAAAGSQEPAKKSADDDLPPLPPSPIEIAEKDGSAVRMSLKDVTKMALQQNIDIAIQDTNEDLNRQRITQAYGSYDPTLDGQFSLGTRKNANTTLYDSSSEVFNQNDSLQWQFTFRQPFQFGGTFQAQMGTNRSKSNSNAMVFNPSYATTMTYQFTQPLLRNLKIDTNRNNIKLANLDLNTSDSQFKKSVTDTISSIQTSYWDLVSAIRNYDIRRNSVKLAQINLRDNRKKLEVGTVAPIEVTDAEATVAAREVDLISAEETILRAENTMRSLISNDRSTDIWKKVIVPTDLPDFKAYKMDEAVAIATAIKNRPELEQAGIKLEQIDLQTRLLNNNRKWQLNLTSSFGTTGNAGPQGCQKYQSGPLVGECILGPDGEPTLLTPPNLVGGMATSYKTMFTEGFYNWQVALALNIPLRNRSLDAQIAQQRIQKSQQLLTVRKTELSIQVEVRNALQTLESNRKQVESAGVARKLAEERLNGEVKRLDAGLSQNYLVLQRQNELSTQEYAELQALIRYKQAIITLQKAMYTLLESNEFEIAKGSSETIPDLK